MLQKICKSNICCSFEPSIQRFKKKKNVLENWLTKYEAAQQF